MCRRVPGFDSFVPGSTGMIISCDRLAYSVEQSARIGRLNARLPLCFRHPTTVTRNSTYIQYGSCCYVVVLENIISIVLTDQGIKAGVCTQSCFCVLGNRRIRSQRQCPGMTQPGQRRERPYLCEVYGFCARYSARSSKIQRRNPEPGRTGMFHVWYQSKTGS
jgi:hypothetical protein